MPKSPIRLPAFDNAQVRDFPVWLHANAQPLSESFALLRRRVPQIEFFSWVPVQHEIELERSTCS